MAILFNNVISNTKFSANWLVYLLRFMRHPRTCVDEWRTTASIRFTPLSLPRKKKKIAGVRSQYAQNEAQRTP